MVQLTGQLVLELSLFSQEICVVSIVELLEILGQGVELPGLRQKDVHVVRQSRSLDPHDFASSQKPHAVDAVLERPPIPSLLESLSHTTCEESTKSKARRQTSC